MTEHDTPNDSTNMEKSNSSGESASLKSAGNLPMRSFLDIAKSSRITRNAIPISVAVDPVELITRECMKVTSDMRKHASWAHSSVSAILGVTSSSPSSPGSFRGSRLDTRDDLARKGLNDKRPTGAFDGADDGGVANRWGLRGKRGKSMQDNPLMAGFARLRQELRGCKGCRSPQNKQVLLLNSCRHSHFRCSLLTASVSPGHSSLGDCRANYVQGPRCNYQVFRIQVDKHRVS